MNNAGFSNLPIKSNILDNLSSLGYEQMTPIQRDSLADILDSKDLIAQAKTGSGKTAAFGIGLLSKINMEKRQVQSLVLCPTRELSEQVCKEIRRLARSTPNIKVLTLCGGSAIGPQMASLRHGAHCVVGTPGRVQDHLRKGTLNLKNVQTLVLDEADRMLEMGFSNELSQIVSYTPGNRQTLLFSATYPKNIQDLSGDIQKNPVVVKVDAEPNTLDIDELYFEATKDQKVSLLCDLIVHYQLQSVVIFCNTKQKCQELAQELIEFGFYASAIHGDLDQRERDEALVLFANRSSCILVATDVAARGLDIEDLQAVVNFELSPDPEVHVHRIGRTGRAGKKGLAFSLFCESESHKLRIIEKYQNKTLEIGDPSELKFNGKSKLQPLMATLRIGCGRKNKLRPADILGALTAGDILLGSEIGKINVCDFHSFVAVSRVKKDIALKLLQEGKIKGRYFKVRHLG